MGQSQFRTCRFIWAQILLAFSVSERLEHLADRCPGSVVHEACGTIHLVGPVVIAFGVDYSSAISSHLSLLSGFLSM